MDMRFCLKVEKHQPLLMVNPAVLQTTTGPAYTKAGRDFAVRFKSVTSESLRFAMERPAISPVVLRGERPWEHYISHFRTVLLDEGRYRLWYETYPPAWTSDHECRLAYAESDDGLAWRRPALRLAACRAARGRSNIVFPAQPDKKFHGATVFKDPSDRRLPYKLIFYGKGADGSDQIEGAVSPDGLRWTVLPAPLVPRYKSDTQTVAWFDADKGKYVGYFRYIYFGRRAIGYAETEDFARWPRPRPMLASGSLQEDLYNNAATRYPWNPRQYFLFPSLYRKNSDTFDIAAWTSPDGLLWERPAPECLLAPTDLGESPDALIMAAPSLLPIEGGRRVALPVTYTRTPHNAVKLLRQLGRWDTGRYHWALWDRDRLGGLRADGDAWAATLPLAGASGRLRLNYRTHMAGVVRVQVGDANGKPIPGYAFETCRLLNGDHPGQWVAWGGRKTLPPGEALVLQFHLRSATLFSITFA